MRKKILLLIKTLDRGGAEQLLLSSAPYLDKTRFDYQIASLSPKRIALVRELKAEGIAVRCLDGETGVAWTRRLKALVRSEGVALVHAHSPRAAIGARVSLPRSVPLVYTEHSVWANYHPATRIMNAVTYPRNDHIFAVSEHVRHSVRFVRPGGKHPRVETLYHGLDTRAVARWLSPNGVRAELGIAPNAPIVGTVANFEPVKGHRFLLEAAILVRREVPNVKFVLVGTGPTQPKMMRRAKSLGLDGSVVFAGYREDAPRIAGAFDVFVLASLIEGLSVALIEAMALGKPLVVTSVGGLPEVVENGRQGLIVPPRSPRALADAIIRILKTPELARQFGEAARTRARYFDIRKAVERVEQVYEELTT